MIKVGVIADAATLMAFDTLLLNHPMQRGAIAQLILIGGRRDAAQGQEVIHAQVRLILGKLHLLNPKRHRHVEILDFL
jgi:hypothetical protein